MTMADTNKESNAPSRFRELEGCNFFRLTADKICVWRNLPCDICGHATANARFDATCTDDDEPKSAGLIPWSGSIPIKGYWGVTDGHESYRCEPCLTAEIKRSEASTSVRDATALLEQ